MPPLPIADRPPANKRQLSLLAILAASVICGCARDPEIVEYTAPRDLERRPFQCTIPAGWQVAGNDQFSELAFEVPVPSHGTARITVSVLTGSGDDFLLMNVNRWRRQVGLGPVESTEGQFTEVPTVNRTVRVFQFVGPSMAIRAGVVVDRGRSWMFKLSGPPAAVTDQADEFDDFLKSLKFVGTPGEQ